MPSSRLSVKKPSAVTALKDPLPLLPSLFPVDQWEDSLRTDEAQNPLISSRQDGA